MCSCKSVQQVYHMQVWEHLLLHSWRAWHGVPAKRLRSQGVCRTSLFFLTSIYVFDSMVFVLFCGATPLPVWLEAKFKLCFQDSHVWTSSRQSPSSFGRCRLLYLHCQWGCYSFVQNAHICRPQQPQKPPKSENKFSQKMVANSPIGNCGIRGLFLGSLDLEPEKIIPSVLGRKPPTDPTNRFATHLCSIWQWDRCEVASFSVHLEIGRFRHICPKLTLDQRICSLCPKKMANFTQSPRAGKFTGDFWRCRHSIPMFFFSTRH